MSLSDLRLKLSYNNQEDDIVKDFLLPALKESIEYNRAVGFFLRHLCYQFRLELNT